MKRLAVPISAFLAGVLVASVIFWIRASFLIPARQIATFANLQSISRLIENYRSAEGRYPHDLAELVTVEPAAGRFLEIRSNGEARNLKREPIYYRSDGTTYLLASAGSDREFRYQDPSRYASDIYHCRSPCSASRADTVIASSGVIQICGK